MKQCLTDDREDDVEMASSGKLGVDTAVEGVEVDLRGDDVGEDLLPIFDNAACGLIACAFDS